MIVYIRTKPLKKALAVAAKLAGRRQTIPVLEAVHLRFSLDGLVIQATDLSTFVELKVPVDKCYHFRKGEEIEAAPSEYEERLIPFRHLYDFVRAWKEGEFIKITTQKDDSIEIQSGGGFLKIAGFPVADWPVFPLDTSDGPTYTAPTLRKALKMVKVAASTDKKRPEVLYGVSIVGSSLVASDGKRLAEYKLELGGTGDGTISAGAVKVLDPFLGFLDRDEFVRVVVQNGNLYLFQSTGGRFVTRLLEGQFPDYLNLVPKLEEFDALATFDVKGALPAFKAAAVGLEEDEAQDPYVGLVTDDGAPHATLISGKGTTTFPAVQTGNYRGNVNPFFLLDALKAIGKGKAVLGLKGERGPHVLGLGAFRYVFMSVVKQ
jgi:DNA polymerase-3 subunit beta